MESLYHCTLSIEVKKCDYRDEQGRCTHENTSCGFRKSSKAAPSTPFIKPEKWYKKYVK